MTDGGMEVEILTDQIRFDLLKSGNSTDQTLDSSGLSRIKVDPAL